jgi:hypothetical protein
MRDGAEAVDEADWERLVDQVTSGDCTPFLGAGACHGTLPTGKKLSTDWAAKHQYPFDDHAVLPRVMQYAATGARDAVYIKQLVTRELSAHGPPDFAKPGEPHGLLARLPLPVYLTTNYDDFMMAALRAARKQPTRVICPWYRGAAADEGVFGTDRGFDPRHEEPIVYHLHGSFAQPSSLVLTEDDYLEFLISLTRDKAGDGKKLVPASILRALTTRPLLFIGYSLEDWTFRVLFHGLLSTIPDVQQRRHVSVQLNPLSADADSQRCQRAEDYLTDHFGSRWNVSLYWGTAESFSLELADRLGGIGWAP